MVWCGVVWCGVAWSGLAIRTHCQRNMPEVLAGHCCEFGYWEHDTTKTFRPHHISTHHFDSDEKWYAVAVLQVEGELFVPVCLFTLFLLKIKTGRVSPKGAHVPRPFRIWDIAMGDGSLTTTFVCARSEPTMTTTLTS